MNGWYQKLENILLSKRGVFVLLTTMFFLVLIGHHSLGVMDRDEARFAQSSKQMLQTNDYIVPRFQDELRAKKPIAIYWFQSFSAKLMGKEKISSYRFPSLIGLLLTLFLTYKFSILLRKTENNQFHGIIAGLFLASSPLIYAEAHLAKVDSFLLAIIIFQQMMLWKIYSDRFKGTKNYNYIYFWLSLSLTILLKGPIGPAVSFLTIISLSLIDRDFKWIKEINFFNGFLILLITVLPWTLAVSILTEGEFILSALKNDFLLKIKSGQESHGSMPGTYLLLLCLLFWPAIIFLFYIPLLGKKLWKNDSFKFCLSWILGYWIILEMIPTKLPHYILPVLPPIALLMTHSLTKIDNYNKIKKGIIFNIFLIFVCINGICIFTLLTWSVSKFSYENTYHLLIILLILFFLFVFIQFKIYLWREKFRIKEIILIPILGVVFNFFIITGIVSNLDKIHVSKALSEEIKKLDFKPNPIAISGFHEPSAVFYLGKDLLLLTAKENALFMVEASNGLAIIEKRDEKEFLDIIKLFDKKVIAVGNVNGFNVSKGRTVNLIIYKQKENK